MYNRREITTQERLQQERFCQEIRARSEEKADLIAVNTCAVREHAEKRVLGNVGALAHNKAKNPELIVCVGGCMAQQETMRERIRRSYRVVDMVFGPHEVWQFPQLLLETMERRGRRGSKSRLIAAAPSEGVVAEGLPRQRDSAVKAWLTIMNGCDNFCSYCIVPYVRGRERSRRPADILAEARELVAAGYKDITLLGQNVNSYGKGLEEDVDFPDLLAELDKIPGDYVLRFMTSHPKDATEKLFRVMAESEHCAHHIHLPLQSGSDRILKEMNRHYDRAKYLEKVAAARAAMPDLVLTTDIIVGFPGVHLYLLPPDGHPGGGYARPGEPGGEAGLVRRSPGRGQPYLRGEARRLCGRHLPGAGGRRDGAGAL